MRYKLPAAGRQSLPKLPYRKVANAQLRPTAIESLERRQLLTSSFAIGIGINDGSTSFMNAAVPKLKSLGVQTVRIYFSTDFNGTDSLTSGVLKRAIDYHNAGFDVMLDVVPINGNIPSYSAVQNWFSWAAGTALKGAVNRWEIGNEPDHSNYWRGSMSQYVTELLQPAYAVLHAAGEEVVSAGPSWNPQDVQTEINAGLLNCCDYIGFHPYADGISMTEARLSQIKAVVQGRKPLVASEWNVRSLEGNPTAWADADARVYADIASTFAINYYYAAEKSGTKAGPAGIMYSDGSPNSLFYNAFATFKNGGTAVGNAPASGGATIGGNVYDDLNGNGVDDSADTASGIRTVFLDTNGNGILDAGEASTTSGIDGAFKFFNVAPGTYNVTRVFPAGYHLTGTSAKYLVVSVSPGQQVMNVNLGSVPSAFTTPPVVAAPPTPVPATNGSIAGKVFDDLNGNGKQDSNEVATGVRTIFLDTNGNGALDAGEKWLYSAADGTFKFAGVAAGTYKVSRIFPAGYHLSTSNTKDVTVSVATGQQATGVNLGSVADAVAAPPAAATGAISGVVFDDLNKDGVMNSSDVVSGIRTVFLDTNGDGILNAGEISTQSAVNGMYKFSGLLPGFYRVTRVFPPGYHLSNSVAKDVNVSVTAAVTLTSVNLGSAKN